MEGSLTLCLAFKEPLHLRLYFPDHIDFSFSSVALHFFASTTDTTSICFAFIIDQYRRTSVSW